jgi:hypothetical protein
MIEAFTTLDIEIEAVEAEVHTVNTSLNELKSTVHGQAVELTSLDFETTELTSALKDMNESTLHSFDTVNNTLMMVMTNLESEISELKINNTQLKTELFETKMSNTELSSAFRELTSVVDVLSKQMENMQLLITNGCRNDADSDNICDNVDSCAYDTDNDIDFDHTCGDNDSCQFDKENDVDSDEICGDVDSCAHDAGNDADSDNICDDLRVISVSVMLDSQELSESIEIEDISSDESVVAALCASYDIGCSLSTGMNYDEGAQNLAAATLEELNEFQEGNNRTEHGQCDAKYFIFDGSDVRFLLYQESVVLSEVRLVSDMELALCDVNQINSDVARWLSIADASSFCMSEVEISCGFNACGVVDASLTLDGLIQSATNEDCLTSTNSSLSVMLTIEGDFLSENTSEIIDAINVAAAERLFALGSEWSRQATSSPSTTSNVGRRLNSNSSIDSNVHNDLMSTMPNMTISDIFILGMPTITSTEVSVSLEIFIPIGSDLSSEIGFDNVTFEAVVDVLRQYDEMSTAIHSTTTTSDILFNIDSNKLSAEVTIGISVGTTIVIIIVVIIVVVKVCDERNKPKVAVVSDHAYNAKTVVKRHSVVKMKKLQRRRTSDADTSIGHTISSSSSTLNSSGVEFTRRSTIRIKDEMSTFEAPASEMNASQSKQTRAPDAKADTKDNTAIGHAISSSSSTLNSTKDAVSTFKAPASEMNAPQSKQTRAPDAKADTKDELTHALRLPHVATNTCNTSGEPLIANSASVGKKSSANDPRRKRGRKMKFKVRIPKKISVGKMFVDL